VSERQWDWPDTPVALRNLETLSALARAIEMAAPGRFVFLLAKCNLPIQRESLARRLRAMLEPLGVELVEIDLDGEVDNLLIHLKARLEAEGQLLGQSRIVITEGVAESPASYATHPPFALSVHGLEASLHSDIPHPPLLTHLNLARERYRELGCPLVLWLPDYALTRLAREAPDFWAWRNGVFEFAPEPEMAESVLRQVAYESAMATASLDAAARRERMMLLERLLEDYRELGDGPQERRAQATILHQLGMLAQAQGDYAKARRLYEESLRIKEDLGDRAEVAQTLHQLGNLAYLRGDYAGARRLYEESLRIGEELDDRAGVALSRWGLGNLAQDQGNYAEAECQWQAALEVFRELGDRKNEAGVLHNLGRLAQARGDYAEARRLYGEAAEVFRNLGARREQATVLHNLGVLAQAQGDYAEARRLYGEAAEVFRDLGARREQAAVLHQLGNLAQAQGDYAEARRLYEESLRIREELGDRAGVAQTIHNLGALAWTRGGYAEARRLYEESLRIKEELGDRAGVARSLHQLGMLAQAQGDYAEARRLYEESLRTFEALGDRADVANGLGRLGRLHEAEGDLAGAVPLWAGAAALFARLRAPQLAQALRDLARVREKMGAEAFRRALEEGAAPIAARHPLAAYRPEEVLRWLEGVEGPVTRHLRQWAPLLRDLAAVCAGQEEARAPVEAALEQAGQSPDWQALAAALRRVMAGERDREALLAGLDEIDTAILTLALDLVEGKPEAQEVVRGLVGG